MRTLRPQEWGSTGGGGAAEPGQGCRIQTAFGKRSNVPKCVLGAGRVLATVTRLLDIT